MLLDPFCGSGKIPIEAALIGRGIAPGIHRTFIAEEWPMIPYDVWQQARTEARDAMRPKLDAPIVGSDLDANAVTLAKHHAQVAGVAADVRFEHRDFAQITASDLLPYGCLIANPPYGERLGELRDAEALYQRLGMFANRLEAWSIYVLTSHKEFERLFGRRSERRRKLFNGRIECTYFQFPGPRPPSPSVA